MGTSNSITREVSILNAGNSLAGTLFLPENERPRSALGMLQGSGAADRDNLGYFPLIREILLNAGVAVLAWDKPGTGSSTGDWRRHTLVERASEAIEAIRFLRSQPETAACAIGLLGHSQGGWVAPIAAAMAPDEVDFIVAQSGPGISVREQALYDVEHVMRYEGHSEDEIERGTAYVQALQDAADRDTNYAAVRAEILMPNRDQPHWEYFPVPDEPMWTYFRRSWQEDPHPRDDLPGVRCPVLAMFGESDPLLPAHESARVYAETLNHAGTDAVTINVFPETGHVLMDPDTGEFVEGYEDLLTSWLHQLAGENST